MVGAVLVARDHHHSGHLAATGRAALGVGLLHPGADAASRRWPAGRFAAVARALRRDGRTVVVTAGADERRLAEEVAQLAGLPSSSVLGGLGDLPFPVLAALVADPRAVVCGDPGTARVASALATLPSPEASSRKGGLCTPVRP